MPPPSRPYVVLTASDAADFQTAQLESDPSAQEHQSIVSLNQLLEYRSKTHPDAIVAGFPSLSKDGEWSWNTWSFSRLLDESSRLADFLASEARSNPLPVRREKDGKERMVVALLSPSNEEFLLAMFACMRLGLGVLLVAPQNTPEAVKELCKLTNSTHLLYHPSLERLANSALPSSSASSDALSTQLVQMPSSQDWNVGPAEGKEGSARSCLKPEDEADTLSIIFHSSGSSGFPKPIFQTHRLWTEPLPYHPGPAAFTTTPLFHGGASDFFRSLTSLSQLYFFPSSLPITSSNLVSSINALSLLSTSSPSQYQPSSSSDFQSPRYFLSVPYILALLAETKDGVALLKTMDLVSTGGSPMPMELGDRLVKEEGVKLVSRYGSSECGFLMTSDRDYEADKDWSYLRTNDAALGRFKLEPYDDNQFSLVVGPNWPSLCTSNQPDGSFASGDLFSKHPTREHAWLLTGRSDDVLLMMNGEKTSPAPLEDALRLSPFISDALIFGANRSTPGALLIPSSKTPASDDPLSPFIPALQKMNALAPRHSQIPPELVILLPEGTAFPRASKGSLQRGQAYKTFEREIEQAYERFEGGGVGGETNGKEDGSARPLNLKGDELTEFVRKVVQEAAGERGEEIGTKEDLFAFGVNSLQSVRIRNVLQKKLDLGGKKLPSNIVFECSSISRLASYIETLVAGGSSEDAASDLDKRELSLMKELVERYGTFPDMAALPRYLFPKETEKIVLTGATGALGAHLLYRFIHSTPPTARITCLVRAQSDLHAQSRVEASLETRRLALTPAEWGRVVCLSSDLGETGGRLGLRESTWEKLSAETTLVVHAAWSVNFVGRLEGFVPHLAGLRNLIDLITSPSSTPQSRLFFCSSTASILSAPLPSLSASAFPEQISTHASDAVPMGYARSKHVAESICAEAARSVLSPSRIGVLRLGQLCGDTNEGVWNESEGWPMMIATATLIGALPALEEHPAWLPVDTAAQAIADVLLRPTTPPSSPTVPSSSTFAAPAKATTPSPLVIHVLNSNLATSFSDILGWIRAAGLKFDAISPEDWVSRLREKSEEGSQHTSLGLLELWEKAYGPKPTSNGQVEDPTKPKTPLEPIFEMTNAQQWSKTLANVEPISKELVEKMVKAWSEKGFIKLG